MNVHDAHRFSTLPLRPDLALFLFSSFIFEMHDVHPSCYAKLVFLPLNQMENSAATVLASRSLQTATVRPFLVGMKAIDKNA
jgi:hypothetical protein